MNRNSMRIVSLAAGITLVLFVAGATASTLSLTDQNSSIVLDPSSSAGMSSWTVNGQNDARQQWFWYSVDGGVQQSLDTLGLTSSGTFVVGSGTRGGYAIYSGANGLGVEVDYLLTGGLTNGQSDLGETIRLTNSGTGSHAIRFYQYSNFNLSQGTSDTEMFPNSNTVNQSGGTLSMQTVVTPVPSAYEGFPFSQTLTGLTGSSSYTLHNTPAFGVGVTPSPNNMTWAYEWDTTLAASGTYIISNDQQINPVPPVPEPWTASLLLASGLTAITARAWRRRRRAANPSMGLSSRQ